MKHVNVSLFVPHLGCPNTCIFCNQRTISGKCERLTPDDVVRAAEIAKKGNYDINNSEIAFFGGSFTMVERSYMLSLLEAAYEYIQKGIFKGIRISTRPDAIDEEILEKHVKVIDLSVKEGDSSIKLTLPDGSKRSIELSSGYQFIEITKNKQTGKTFN